MSKKHAKLLKLEDKVCRFGKISNNLEKHGDDWVTAFTIPVSGLMLTKEELNQFMRDKYCHAAWFDTKAGMTQPQGWWGEEFFPISQSFEAEGLTIIVSGDRTLEFEAEEAEDQDDEDDVGRPACEITKIRLTPQVGGHTEMAFSLSLRPDVGKKNLMLQEHQHREVKITLVDAKASEKNARQGQLPMGAPGAKAEGDGSDAAATH
jgi:hypothetical protein